MGNSLSYPVGRENTEIKPEMSRGACEASLMLYPHSRRARFNKRSLMLDASKHEKPKKKKKLEENEN